MTFFGHPIILPIQGDGYDCRTNQTSGDGSWSNVVSQREWVLGHIAGSITGAFDFDDDTDDDGY